MMANNDINYESNAKEVKKALDAAQNAVLYAIGAFVMQEAVVRAPTNKHGHGGNLKGGINFEVNESAKYTEIGSPAEYAPYVEVGTGVYSSKGDGRKTAWRYKTPDGKWVTTVGNKPQPFLEPAVTQNTEKIKRLAEGEFEFEMNKHDKGGE